MAAPYRETCIVLRKTKLGETDLILTMLSQEGGLVKGVAKGARKPGNKRFGARLEPYSVVDLQLYPGKSLDSITECRCVEPNAACREDLAKYAACGYMVELMDKCIRDGEVGPKVFQMMIAALKAIESTESSMALTFALGFQLKALSMMGFRPVIHSCTLCGCQFDNPACFNISAGGSLCEECSKGSEGDVDLTLVPWVDLFIRSTFDQLSAVDNVPQLQLLDFCDSWIGEHLGMRLKTSSFLRTTVF